MAIALRFSVGSGRPRGVRGGNAPGARRGGAQAPPGGARRAWVAQAAGEGKEGGVGVAGEASLRACGRGDAGLFVLTRAHGREMLAWTMSANMYKKFCLALRLPAWATQIVQ